MNKREDCEKLALCIDQISPEGKEFLKHLLRTYSDSDMIGMFRATLQEEPSVKGKTVAVFPENAAILTLKNKIKEKKRAGRPEDFTKNLTRDDVEKLLVFIEALKTNSTRPTVNIAEDVKVYCEQCLQNFSDRAKFNLTQVFERFDNLFENFGWLCDVDVFFDTMRRAGLDPTKFFFIR